LLVFAYGTANAAIKGKLSFLVYFPRSFAWRILGKKNERQLMYKFDLQELCIIQVLQILVFWIDFECLSLVAFLLCAQEFPWV